MGSEDLKAWQLHRLIERLRPDLGYLTRLWRRMESTSFPPDDSLYKLVCESQALLQQLVMQLHYLACDASRR
jgi:hypothetical protein